MLISVEIVSIDSILIIKIINIIIGDSIKVI